MQNPLTIWKFILAIIWDLLDFTIFRIPGLGTITDIIAIPFAVWLWGPAGIMAMWEVLDVSDQVDSFIPTVTLIGLLTFLWGHE